MAREYISLGPTPCDEDCVPAGTHPSQEIKECNAYKRQLRRMFPNPPENTSIGVKYFYTGGGYREVVVYYDDNSEASWTYAINVERNLPAKWDELAKIDLLPSLAETLADLPADLAAGPESRYS
jgi:hypothetical protein